MSPVVGNDLSQLALGIFLASDWDADATLSQVDSLESLLLTVANDPPILALCRKRSGSLEGETMVGFDQVVCPRWLDIVAHVMIGLHGIKLWCEIQYRCLVSKSGKQ